MSPIDPADAVGPGLEKGPSHRKAPPRSFLHNPQLFGKEFIVEIHLSESD